MKNLNHFPPFQNLSSLTLVESQLISIGYWVIRSVQLIGYLPLRIEFIVSTSGGGSSSPQRTLRIKWFNSIILRSFFLSSLTLLCNWHFFHKQKRYFRLINIFGPTEVFAHTLMVVITSVTGQYLRALGLVESKETLRFWKENCHTFERVTLGGLDLLPGGKYEEIFNKIRADLRKSLLGVMVPGALHLILIFGYKCIVSIYEQGRWWRKEVQFYVGSTFWIGLSFLHISHPLWMIFFIKLYAGAFKVIRLNLMEGGRREWTWPRVYTSELFGSTSTLTIGHSRSSPDEARIMGALESFHVLEKQIKGFNEYFGRKLALEMILCIVTLLVYSFFSCLWISRGLPLYLSSLLVHLVLYTKELYQLGSEGFLLTRESRKIVKVLQTLPLEHLSLETQIKVQLFVTAVSTNPPVISAGHFFTINRQMVTSILCSMTTFLVVLVQFKDSDDSGYLNWLNKTSPTGQSEHIPTPPTST